MRCLVYKIIRINWSVRFLTILAVVIALTGCVKNEILVKVKGDGSGNIVVTRVFCKEVVTMFQAQMDEMKKSMGAAGADLKMSMPDDPFYNEKALRKEAGQFGPGVEFVKAQKYERDGMRGSVTIYSFKDVNEIFVNAKMAGAEFAQSMATIGSDEVVVAEKGDEAFSFKLVRGPECELKLLVPDVKSKASAEPDGKSSKTKTDTGKDATPAKDEKKENLMDKPAFNNGPEMAMLNAGGNPFGFTGKETQGEVAKKMMKGMLMSVAVEVDGKDVKASASHPHKSKPNRFVLMEIDMDKMMASPKFGEIMGPEMMSGMGGMGGSGFLESMINIPGMTVETCKTASIRFKSAATAPEDKKDKAKTKDTVPAKPDVNKSAAQAVKP